MCKQETLKQTAHHFAPFGDFSTGFGCDCRAFRFQKWNEWCKSGCDQQSITGYKSARFLIRRYSLHYTQLIRKLIAIPWTCLSFPFIEIHCNFFHAAFKNPRPVQSTDFFHEARRTFGSGHDNQTNRSDVITEVSIQFSDRPYVQNCRYQRRH